MYPPQSACHSILRPAWLFATIAVWVLAALLLNVAQCLAQSQTAASAKRSSVRRALPLTKFYDTSSPLAAGRPGELIRSEAADEYYLSADFSAFRILYHSRSASGQDVAASAVVLAPEAAPPAGGWPVIAWAHRFTGPGRECAPSLLRNLYYGPFLSMYVNLGYAVVAPDYTGLGTSFRNAAMDVPSNAGDVIDAIQAAHAAVPQLGPRWVAMGVGLGAGVAIGVAEMEGQIRDANYLGSIAISGVANLEDEYAQPTKEQSLEMLELLAYGIKNVYPDFDLRDMLTGKALPAYEQINQNCGSVSNRAELSTTEMLKPNWRNNKFVEQFFARNRLGQRPAYGPVLVISDEADSTVLPTMTAQVVASMCKQGDRIQLDKFFDPQPDLVLGDSVRDQMAWIEARFAGRAASKVECSERSDRNREAGH
jgi:secretory lipase